MGKTGQTNNKNVQGRAGLSKASETANPVTIAVNAIAYQTNLFFPALIGLFGPHGAEAA